MPDGQMWGWIGGIVGGLMGLLGGLFGTYRSIRNTNGPRERQFITQFAVVCWIAVGIMLGLTLLLPNPYRWLVWGPYAIVLPIGIRYCNRRQDEIRQKELAEDADQSNGGTRDL